MSSRAPFRAFPDRRAEAIEKLWNGETVPAISGHFEIGRRTIMASGIRLNSAVGHVPLSGNIHDRFSGSDLNRFDITRK